MRTIGGTLGVGYFTITLAESGLEEIVGFSCSLHHQRLFWLGIVGRVGRATARYALCRGFDPCRQRPQGVAVDFGLNSLVG